MALRAVSTLFLLIVCISLKSQTIASMARSICDSIQKVAYLPYEEGRKEQRRIYHDELTRYPTLRVDITGLNRPREFNEYNYRINRELLKKCDGYIDQFSLIPLSKILDLEGLLSESHYDSLEGRIIQFIYAQKLDLVVITIDDFYPHDTFDNYLLEVGKEWNIGGRYQNGGLLLAYSSVTSQIGLYTGKLKTGGERLVGIESDLNELLEKKDSAFALLRSVEIIDEAFDQN
ncbi:MAG: TPM domain-containing protein [Vicingaceae bacterium]